MELTEFLQQDKDLQQLATGLTQGGRHLMTGISGTARTVWSVTAATVSPPLPIQAMLPIPRPLGTAARSI